MIWLIQGQKNEKTKKSQKQSIFKIDDHQKCGNTQHHETTEHPRTNNSNQKRLIPLQLAQEKRTGCHVSQELIQNGLRRNPESPAAVVH